MVPAVDVLTERRVVVADTRIRGSSSGRRTYIADAGRPAPQGSRQVVRGAGRNRLVQEIHVVRDLVVLPVGSTDPADAPLVRRAQPDFVTQVFVGNLVTPG